MKVKKILYASKFLRSLKALDPSLRQVVAEREALFRANAFDPKLKTHKLKGSLTGYWSFSLTHSHRVLFEIIEEGIVALIDVGDHSIYG